MTSNEYLYQLRRNLRGMTEEEIDNIIEYYSEYFFEAGIENEQAVIEELGSPVKLGIRLSGEAALRWVNEEQEKPKKRGAKKPKSLGKVLLIAAGLILSSPFIFPVAVILASLAFALIVTLASLLFAAGVVAVSGIIAFVCGIVYLFTQGLLQGIYMLGLALTMVGGGMMAWFILRRLIVVIRHWIVDLGNRKLNRGKNYETETE